LMNFLLVSLFLISYLIAANDDQWDFLQFVQEWPPVTCLKYSQQHCVVQSNVKDFTIHGLWPQRFDGSWPQFCDSGNLNRSTLVPIEYDMQLLWPSFLMNNSCYDFWDHEWTKHGTCVARASPFVMNQFEYFLMTLNLRYRYNFADILLKEGVLPDDEKKYPVSLIQKVLKRTIGVVPKLICHKKKFLHGVWLCINKNFEFIDCPDSSRLRFDAISSCLSEVLFIPFQHTSV